MPRLDHESEPLTFREQADHRSYYRVSIVTVSGAGHLADVASYDQHPDDDPAGSADVPHRRLDPRAYGHAVLFANSARMYDLLHRLLPFVSPDDGLPEADTAAEARASFSRGWRPTCPTRPRRGARRRWPRRAPGSRG